MTVSAIGPEVCETADVVEYLKMPSRGRRGRGRGLQVTPKNKTSIWAAENIFGTWLLISHLLEYRIFLRKLKDVEGQR